MASLGLTAPHNPNKDVELVSPPADGVSGLAWSSKALLLAGSSWDGQVRIWEVASNGASAAKASYGHEGPVLCVAWSGDGGRVFSGGCDHKARCYTLGGQTVQVGQHAAPIKSLAYLDELGVLVTGSWDRTLKYWDGRQAGPVGDVALPERVYAMDLNYPLLVVATAERHILVYDCRKPQAEYKRLVSPLKFQTRCIAAFPDRTGFCVGSIEGRVGVHHVEDRDASKNFAFKCHRDGNDVYAVNSIAFHPQHGTFATAGSDGAYNFWDKENKQRLKPFLRANQPIPCGAFSPDGNIFAYAVSYDWSKGAEYYNPATSKNYILLHAVNDSEIRARKGAK
jgi:mRNA export factor